MIFSKSNALSSALMLSLFVLLGSTSAVADDTEIFFSATKTSVNPNVMFIIDVSGSMNQEIPGSDGDTRLKVMQRALKTMLSTAPTNLNVGLMNYGEVQWYNQGHGVKFPIKDIESLAEPVVTEKITNSSGYVSWWNSSIPKPSESTVTVRQYLGEITEWYFKDNWHKAVIDGVEATPMAPHGGITPIVDALYEAALYFRGEAVTFGLSGTGYWARTSAHQSTYEGPGIQQVQDSCVSTTTKKLWEQNDFAANERDWFRCPADNDNPATPGTYENCQENESCEFTTEYGCLNVAVEGYCSNKTYDEFGNYTCADGAWVSDVCDASGYGNVTEAVCEYELCDTGYAPEPDYISPITQSCQSNFIVIMSDGKPVYEDGTASPGPVYTKLASGEFSPILDKSDSTNQFDNVDCEANLKPSSFDSGVCGPELTKFLSEADHSDLDGAQTIDTYAIGFGLSVVPVDADADEIEEAANAVNYMKSLVTTDDPATPEVEGYFAAEDEVQLSQAFSHILTKISSTTTSFASPGYSVDFSTGLFNEDDIYIPVFDKGLTPRWSGNLKKFKLRTDAAGNNFVADKNGDPAVDNLGVFTEDAVDVWSTASTGDGREVNKGGVAQLIDPNMRNAVTDLGCTGYPCDLLGNDDNKIHPDNDVSNDGVITSAKLGLDSDVTESTRINMLNFIRGRKWNAVTGAFESHPHMGDMLHTEPLIVTYDEEYSSETNPVKHGQVIFAATNEGYIHAFDTVTGEEIFAYMPSPLMKNIPVQYYNSRIGQHAYGIDGIMSKREFEEEDGTKRVVLYFGLRRGGRAYYALDVSNVEDPKLMWKIDADAQTALNEKLNCQDFETAACTVSGVMGKGDFARLGQSWSTPYLARIRINGSATGFKDVVIFSGGYDTNQDEEDDAVRATSDTVGNDVFIVDAFNGDLLWSAQDGGPLGSRLSNRGLLKHSIPGGMRILDMNQDGAVDRMYFADTRGRVYRLELPIGPSFDMSDAKLIRFASLGSGTGVNRRMFFNEPDVALLKKNGQKWLTVSLGSGYRAHPANEEVQDRFYVLLDSAVHNPLEKNIECNADFTRLGHGDLVKVTVSGDETVSSINQREMSNTTILEVENKAGWYLNMPKVGEKVLASSITTEGDVMFTSLVPDIGASAATSDLCTAPLTQGRFYSFNILTGEAGSDLNRDGTITDIDLMKTVTANEIPGTPQRVFNRPTCDSEAKQCSQIVDIRVGKRKDALTTYDASLLESVFWTNPERN